MQSISKFASVNVGHPSYLFSWLRASVRAATQRITLHSFIKSHTLLSFETLLSLETYSAVISFINLVASRSSENLLFVTCSTLSYLQTKVSNYIKSFICLITIYFFICLLFLPIVIKLVDIF